MESAAIARPAEMKTYAFQYQRVWKDGQTTEHSVAYEAFGRETAETMFYWRLDFPQDVLTQRLVSVQASPRR